MVRLRREKIKKILKRTGLTLCAIALSGTIAVGSYDAYLDAKLDKIEISKEKIEVIP